MRKGSLVLLNRSPPGVPHEKAGIVVKGPYGAVIGITIQDFTTSCETKVADVLFGNQVVRKVPIKDLSVLK